MKRYFKHFISSFERPFFIFSLSILFTIFFCDYTFSQAQKQYLRLQYEKKNLNYGLQDEQPSDIPKVALALSGGGSRGLGQIGVLKALKEAKIPIHLIVGTSMGSIVGGLYASGYDLNDLDSIFSVTDWEDLLTSDRKTNRRELFIDQKFAEDKSIIAIRFKGLTPIFPTSINDGQKFTNFLNLLALQSPVPIKENFDDLEIPFRAVSTNLATGEPFVLKNGLLTHALRASSSVTFLLAPVQHDSLILVDGGLVANIPVSISKKEGVDFVIAVNTTSELSGLELLDKPWIVADQVVSIPMRLLNIEQIKLADFVIAPPLRNKLANDFTFIDSVIENSYQYTLALVDSLVHIIDSNFQQHLRKNEQWFKNIIISEQSLVGRDYLTKYINRDSISSAELLFDLYKINVDSEYEDIYAVIEKSSDYSVLSFDGKKKDIVRSYSFGGVNLINTSQVEGFLQSLIGKPYTGRKISNTIKEIIRLFRNSGYALAELDSLHFDNTRGNLYLRFKEGVISEIKINGNIQTDRTVISREFPLGAGDIFSYKSVQQGLTNLRSTNLFDNIVISVEKSRDSIVVVVNLTEKVSSLLRVGLKVDNENKSQLYLDIRNENILGTATELGLLLHIGDRSRSFILEHKATRVFDSYLTYAINTFYEAQEVFLYRTTRTQNSRAFSRSVDGEYRQAFYGFSISLGSQVTRFGNFIIKAKYAINEVNNLRENLISPYKNTTLSFKASTTIDSQDKYPYPDNGVKITGYYETAQKILGGEVGYTNFGFNYKGYLTLNGKHTFSTALNLGFADKTLPLAQQYSLGGQYSFFGMREYELRGRQVATGALEYRYFLPTQIIFDTYLSLRYDLGSIWSEQEQIRFKDFRHGIGASLSFNTPIGPADFSIGRTFLFEDYLPKSRTILGPVSFYFSIGYYY